MSSDERQHGPRCLHARVSQIFIVVVTNTSLDHLTLGQHIFCQMKGQSRQKVEAFASVANYPQHISVVWFVSKHLMWDLH